MKGHDRTGQPVEERLHKVQEDGYLKNRDDADKFNLAMDDENIDFNISGIPDATVKRSQSISVHELIQKIESHPQKEAIQNDLGKQDPWKSVVAEDRLGQLDRFSSTDYSELDYDRAWSSQEWKNEVTTHDRSGQHDQASWSMVQQVRPHHEATLLDGTAQSVRYGEPLRDRSGQPDNVNSQEAANSQNFIMGGDATEFCESGE